MGRRRQDEGGAAVADIAPAEQPPAPKRPAAWRFHFKSKWTLPFLTIAGVESEKQAREMLHDLLDRSITKVEATR